MISKEEVNREVKRIADESVGGFVSVESLILFITRAKGYAEDKLEEYLFTRSENSDLLGKVDEVAFNDFSDGYIAKMRDWQRSNPMYVSKTEDTLADEISDASTSSDDEAKAITRKSVTDFSLGSLIALGFGAGVYICGGKGVIVALIAEAIVVAWAKKRHGDNMTAYNERREQKRKEREVRVMNDLVDQVATEVNDWLAMGMNKGKEVEKTFYTA